MMVGAVFPVGTSDGGCPAALAEILQTEAAVEVHLIYGRRGDLDAADPADSVARIKSSSDDSRIVWSTEREVEPFDLSLAYPGVREFVAEIAARGYERVYVGITGATNPIVTSLFQSAMSYLTCEVIPVYVRSRGDGVQHFRASSVRDRILAEEALALARSGQVRLSASLAQRLQSEDCWRFFAASLMALASWDDFDYGQARQGLEHQARKAERWLDDPLLAPSACTIRSISGYVGRASDLVKRIRDPQNFGKSATNPESSEEIRTTGPIIVADAYANAQRRMAEGRYTDAVLRAYRAAECATQMQLLAKGIHPSKPDACSSAFARYPRLERKAENGGLREIAFRAGLAFLAEERIIDLTPIETAVRNLCSTRNSTYLEHGYIRVTRENASKCLEGSKLICEYLLGDLSALVSGLTMRF